MPNLVGTRGYIAALERHDVKYDILDPDENGEYVSVIWTSDEDEATIVSNFTKSGCTIANYIFNLYKTDLSDPHAYVRILSAVNDLNRKYRWVRFYADREKNRVNCDFDVYLGDDPRDEELAGEIAYFAMDQMSDICFQAIDYLRSKV